DEAELDAALATDARVIGINNRDLRTLDVDTERADRLRALVPDDRIVIAESGVRDASTIRRWRALGFDAALVGEALMRSDDRRGQAAGLLAGGRGAAASTRGPKRLSAWRRAGSPTTLRTSRVDPSSRSVA